MPPQLLGHGFLVGLLSPPLSCLGLVAKDEIEFVLVARTLTSRLSTLVASRLGFVALLRGKVAKVSKQGHTATTATVCGSLRQPW